MKELIIILFLFHGLIHLFGFSKAYQIQELDQFTQVISKTEGSFWLVASILFLISAISLLIDQGWWIYIAVVSLVFSQILILKHWFDARMGTIVNVIILIVIFISFNVK